MATGCDAEPAGESMVMVTVIGDAALITPPARLIVKFFDCPAGIVCEPPRSVNVPSVLDPLSTASVTVPGVPPGGLIGSKENPLFSVSTSWLPVVSVAEVSCDPAVNDTVVEA